MIQAVIEKLVDVVIVNGYLWLLGRRLLLPLLPFLPLLLLLLLPPLPLLLRLLLLLLGLILVCKKEGKCTPCTFTQPLTDYQLV